MAVMQILYVFKRIETKKVAGFFLGLFTLS